MPFLAAGRNVLGQPLRPDTPCLLSTYPQRLSCIELVAAFAYYPVDQE